MSLHPGTYISRYLPTEKKFDKGRTRLSQWVKVNKGPSINSRERASKKKIYAIFVPVFFVVVVIFYNNFSFEAFFTRSVCFSTETYSKLAGQSISVLWGQLSFL